MSKLAVIVNLTHADQLESAIRELNDHASDVHELVVVDDGAGLGGSVRLKAWVAAWPGAKLISYSRPSFFLGSWKPVVDELSSEYLHLYQPGVRLPKGYLSDCSHALVGCPEAGVAYADLVALFHANSGNQPASSGLVSPQLFTAEMAERGQLCNQHFRTAVYRRAVWWAAGGIRSEYDAAHLWLGFLLVHASAPGLYLGDRGCFSTLPLPLPSLYREPNVFRSLDDLARMRMVVDQNLPPSARPDCARAWYERAVDDFLNLRANIFHGHLIAANKLVDEVRPRLSFAARLLAGPAQKAMGLARRSLGPISSRSLRNYTPDVGCYTPVKPTFSFGVNWRKYITQRFDEERLSIAQRDILEFLALPDLRDKTFLDIGCGSGIHSLAAWKAGAKQVFSFDYDVESVNSTRLLHERAGRPENWTVAQGSILDAGYVASLPRADIVYSWGVLHHTGQMWRAIEAAADCIKPGGVMFIALYNKWVGSDDALRLKIRYNQASWVRKRIMEVQLMRQGLPGWSYLFKDFAFFRDRWMEKYRLARDYKKYRGMSFYHDIVDWIGGYPYEDCTVEETLWFCRKHCGLISIRVNARGGNDCSHYLFAREDQSTT